jgi:hypothetical protein
MRHLAILTALASSCVFASPSWYGEVPSDANLSYGFGQGNSYQQAKDNAYHDLAKSIESRVISEMSSSKEFKNGKLSKSASSNMTSLSDIVFRNNVTINKSEKIEGKFYLEVQYDPTSFAQKLSHWLKGSQCNNKLHPYWSNTALLQNWVEQHQCLPHIDIERFAGGWQITNSSGHLVLPEAQYNHLFFNHHSSSLSVESTSARLNEGDYYFINLKTQKAGYLSLFQVYEDGSTGVLLENQLVSKRTDIEFPDKKLYDGIEALLNQGNETYDTNIALLCPNKIDTSRFEKLDESRLSTDTPGFGLILRYLEKCDFVMERLSISKA